MYSILRYDETKLPKDVRATVKSTYYDYAITHVKEISLPDKTVFLVYLHFNGSWKIVRLCNREMEEIEDLNER